jgi:hypothetical protein
VTLLLQLLRSALPMLPTPTTTRSSRLHGSKNAWWIALSARICCDASMTHEMLARIRLARSR